MAALSFPQELRQNLLAYIPPQSGITASPTTDSATSTSQSRPYVTLTYAQSLDGQISLSPGQPTVLSGPASKAMTHYLRSVHDGILVGSGTAIADDPGLNCRLEDVVGSSVQTNATTTKGLDAHQLKRQPRPIILDRRGRWNVSSNSKVIKLAQQGRGRAPWIIIGENTYLQVSQDSTMAVSSVGGEYCCTGPGTSLDFPNVLDLLAQKGLRSVMVEGGGSLINQLLAYHQDCIDSLIVTIAPVYLGQGGVAVKPNRHTVGASDIGPAVKTRDVSYMILGNDIVLCAKIDRDSGVAP